MDLERVYSDVISDFDNYINKSKDNSISYEYTEPDTIEVLLDGANSFLDVDKFYVTLKKLRSERNCKRIIINIHSTNWVYADLDISPLDLNIVEINIFNSKIRNLFIDIKGKVELRNSLISTLEVTASSCTAIECYIKDKIINTDGRSFINCTSIVSFDDVFIKKFLNDYSVKYTSDEDVIRFIKYDDKILKSTKKLMNII